MNELLITMPDSDDAVTVNASSVVVSGMSTTQYVAFDVIAVATYGGIDSVTVTGTHSGMTMLMTGEGDDEVTVLGTNGLLDLQTEDGNDELFIRGISALTTADMGAGDDEVTVASVSLAGGVLTEIMASFVVSGSDGASDKLFVDASGDASGRSGVLSGSSLTGLGMGSLGAVTFESMDLFRLELGRGGDQLRVDATHGGRTEIDGNSGDDRIEIHGIGGETAVFGDMGSDTVDVYLTPIGGAVTTVNSFNSRLEIIGGTGSGQIDALNVRSAFPFEDEARLTQDRLTGFAMAVDFAYTELEVVGIELGVGANLFTIESTHAGRTMLHTGAGDDSVEVVATGGVVDLQTADGKDMVRIGAIGAEMSLNTGEGDDRIHVGSRALASDGTLDGISSQLSVVGGAGFDMLKADDSGDTTANIGSLNATTLQGLGMAGSIAYGLVETLSILLG
ncbi:MAG: hypothetical protein ACK56G_01905, partial [Pirellulaceae bacterium]